MPSTKRKREYYAAISVSLLLFSVFFTYQICRWSGESFFDSWASSLGECIVAGAILLMQIKFVKQISILIHDSDLDLVPVRKTFCANLSVVGFIFLVQCGDMCLHIITNIFLNKSVTEQQNANSTTFLILALTVQCCLIGAYFSFFLLIFRSTHGARSFEDLILYKEVPELVYLQTRKLLRDQQYQRAEKRRTTVWRSNSVSDRRKSMDDLNESKVSSSRNKSVSFNPNLQSQRSEKNTEDYPEPQLIGSADAFIQERKKSVEIAISGKDINRLSSSYPPEPEIQRITHDVTGDNLLKSSLKKNTYTEILGSSDKSMSYLKPKEQTSSSKKSSMADAQSFYTAQDLSNGKSPAMRQTESDYMSALDSNTPYQQMIDKPMSIEMSQSKVSSGGTGSLNKEPVLITIKEELNSREQENENVRKMAIEDGKSEDEDDLVSNDSQGIRDKAQQIINTYNERLIKVGHRQFQIRLNIFFTFVQASTVEAEPYDHLQSVEGSVMNASDSSVIERMYERTNSRLSQISAFTGTLSD